jgi:MFS superfamily sulfate permease-like transporter
VYRVSQIAPGLAMLRGYQLDWLRYDVAAGLSVAAVALPIAIAYAQLAGFPPVVGLYASILPLVVYAALGTSRRADRSSRQHRGRHDDRPGR